MYFWATWWVLKAYSLPGYVPLISFLCFPSYSCRIIYPICMRGSAALNPKSPNPPKPPPPSFILCLCFYVWGIRFMSPLSNETLHMPYGTHTPYSSCLELPSSIVVLWHFWSDMTLIKSNARQPATLWHLTLLVWPLALCTVSSLRS